MKSLLIIAFLILSGCTPSFLITPISSNQSLRETIVEDGSGDKIVIIEVEGMLMNVRTGGFLQAQENDVSLFAQQLKKAEKDSGVKAIVLRINSPAALSPLPISCTTRSSASSRP